MKNLYPLFISIIFISACSGFGYVEMRLENLSHLEITEIKVDQTSFGDLQPGGLSTYKDLERPLSSRPAFRFFADGKEIAFPEEKDAELLSIDKYRLKIFYDGISAEFTIVSDE